MSRIWAIEGILVADVVAVADRSGRCVIEYRSAGGMVVKRVVDMGVTYRWANGKIRYRRVCGPFLTRWGLRRAVRDLVDVIEWPDGTVERL